MLFVAGETSGDRIVAKTLRELDVRAYGLAGEATEQAGGELLFDLRAISSVGALDVLSLAPSLARAAIAIVRAVLERRPKVALLVDFTELNARLGPWLRSRGVRVLWCVAPQVWAWRPHRARTLRRAMDRLAVLFSFEEERWRKNDVDTHWVGHPALDAAQTTREEARVSLGITSNAPLVAILPGSRRREVSRLLPAMLEAARNLGVDTRLLLAPSLDDQTNRAARELAARHGTMVVNIDPNIGLSPLLPAFDASLVCSGTASLEAALAGASPVVAYRLDYVAALVARRLITTPHIALPNVLLRRRELTELVQDDVTAKNLSIALENALKTNRAHAREVARELREIIDVGDGKTMGARVADLLKPWL